MKPVKALCFLVMLLLPQAALAARDPALLCEQAAQVAARREGVPLDVMRALTLTETGHRRDGTLRPWPWAINRAGEGHWFQTEAEAMAFATSTLAQGARNFDVGCFQLNHRWHADGFPNLRMMFDPVENALYAARFLRRQYDQTGDWTRAAGAYHSLTPEHAQRYSARFAELREGLDSPQVARAEARVNSFPLLRGGRGTAGSLVPAGGLGLRLIGN
ncbi:transglycosylase SLT domain-containing protein [Falsirhodobacter sp. 1013]|uniref:transglycosylase SLT domain-containing protein n=1 Tax=Falsirhodobacter sp. 1013 TaxID=3417566 RepID=UPI003EBB4416